MGGEVVEALKVQLAAICLRSIVMRTIKLSEAAETTKADFKPTVTASLCIRVAELSHSLTAFLSFRSV